jgi:hypothetical protein
MIVSGAQSRCDAPICGDYPFPELVFWRIWSTISARLTMGPARTGRSATVWCRVSSFDDKCAVFVLLGELGAPSLDILQGLSLREKQAQLLNASPHGPAILSRLDVKHGGDSSLDHPSL